MSRGRVQRKPSSVSERRCCGECSHVDIVTSFHTLSIGGAPTLGRCPYYENGVYCVLLSQAACGCFAARDSGAE